MCAEGGRRELDSWKLPEVRRQFPKKIASNLEDPLCINDLQMRMRKEDWIIFMWNPQLFPPTNNILSASGVPRKIIKLYLAGNMGEMWRVNNEKCHGRKYDRGDVQSSASVLGSWAAMRSKWLITQALEYAV